ncbi:MAG: adenosylmethionine--8-amino-7-oxononanoate transaminase [Gammaproteobacteria bacterium RIFCSPHIGHO2_12_FULL_37_14]|nr:MAG: adenosylmethionine--8-amino-7-oxononanoate transaminase [Gammaproteobacteria bacterium RIFCSPHIGHO2_12_FULL_37_14]
MHSEISSHSKMNNQPLWYPCSQMKDYETFKPLPVVKAYGSYIELSDGSKIIDAISSWWCKSLGHGHPRLKKALLKQIDKFEHVILANTTNETIISLTHQLATLLPSLNKVCYASDGSCAVEMALKMSMQSRQILGEHHRTKFITLANSYHGETLGALSVGDVGLYRQVFKPILFEPIVISPIPYIFNKQDPLWYDCGLQWSELETKLSAYANVATALIVEPIIQAAGGMKIYSKDLLYRLRKWTKENNIHFIADEIMTGLGRTGKLFACQHANIIPDFLCIGKSLTSGWLPLSALLTNDAIYNIFYDTYDTGKSFLHSHTYAGNALAASIASEVLSIFNDEKICEQATILGEQMLAAMQDIADDSKKINHVRGLGAMVAADLICDQPQRRLGYEVYQEAVKKGALLRPLGNTIYWVPPLNMDKETLYRLKEITLCSIMSVN